MLREMFGGCGMSETIIHEPMQEVITVAGLAGAKFRALYERAMTALQDGYSVEIACKPLKSTRSLEANACMWACLSDISRQVVWHGNKLSPDEWKEVISAGLRQQRVVPGMDGGFVVLGVRTSRMSIKEMSAMIELCLAFGAQQGVRFSAPKWVGE